MTSMTAEHSKPMHSHAEKLHLPHIDGRSVIYTGTLLGSASAIAGGLLAGEQGISVVTRNIADGKLFTDPFGYQAADLLYSSDPNGAHAAAAKAAGEMYSSVELWGIHHNVLSNIQIAGDIALAIGLGLIAIGGIAALTDKELYRSAISLVNSRRKGKKA